MNKTYCKSISTIIFIVLYLAVSAEAEERIHWYIQQGKGRPLCESLTQIANSNPPMPPLERIIPNIPWKQVLAIEGVREPGSKELDPLKYEDFFLKARKFKASENTYDEQVIPFIRWLLPPKERWVDRSLRKIPISDAEALKDSETLFAEAASSRFSDTISATRNSQYSGILFNTKARKRTFLIGMAIPCRLNLV